MASNEAKWFTEEQRKAFLGKADIALVGGTPEERLVEASRLRRLGISVYTEFKNRNKQRMYKQAQQEAYKVVDIEKCGTK